MPSLRDTSEILFPFLGTSSVNNSAIVLVFNAKKILERNVSNFLFMKEMFHYFVSDA